MHWIRGIYHCTLFKIFYWNRMDLHYHVNFHYSAEWFSYTCMCLLFKKCSFVLRFITRIEYRRTLLSTRRVVFAPLVSYSQPTPRPPPALTTTRLFSIPVILFLFHKSSFVSCFRLHMQVILDDICLHLWLTSLAVMIIFGYVRVVAVASSILPHNPPLCVCVTHLCV